MRRGLVVGCVGVALMLCRAAMAQGWAIYSSDAGESFNLITQ